VRERRRVETERLLMRAPEPGDVRAIFDRYASDVDVTRYLGWPRPQHRASWHVMEKCGFGREGVLRRHTVFPNLSPGPEDVLLDARIF